MTRAYFEELFASAEKKAKELDAEQYELYYSGSEDISAETFRDELSEFSVGTDGLMIVRLTVNGKAGGATSTLATPEEAAKLIENAVENAKLIEKEDKVYFCKGGQSYEELPISSFDMPSAAAIKEVAMKLRNALYASSPEISDGTSGVAYAGTNEIYLYSSEGLRLSNFAGSSGGYAVSVLSRGDEKRSGYKMGCGMPEELNIDEMVATANEKASETFGAGFVKSGNYPVVFEGRQFEQILGAFVSSFYAKEVQNGTSLLKDKEGHQIANERLTLIDDPFYPKNSMQISFDGEGTPTYTKAVIENGVLNTLLYNLETAAVAGKASTGNGSRGGAAIGTKFYNLYIKPGDKTREELFKMANGGIFVTAMKGFHAGANSVTGDFSIESEGFLIENGKKGKPIKSFTVSGNFFELLKEIGAIGEEIENDIPGYTKIRCPDVFIPTMPIAGE